MLVFRGEGGTLARAKGLSHKGARAMAVIDATDDGSIDQINQFLLP